MSIIRKGRRGLCSGLLILSGLCSAAAACDVQSGLDLKYRADQERQGAFWVRVSCAPGETAYRLRLIGLVEDAGPTGTLRVRMQDRDGTDGLDIALLNTWPTLGSLARTGTSLTGSHDLSFEVLAAAGQWIPAGSYLLPLTVILEPVAAP